MNSVIGVTNLLFWKGGNVSKVVTRISLADIVYDSTKQPQYFKQFFDLKWIYDSSSLINTSSLATVGSYNSLINSQSYLNGLTTGLSGYVTGDSLVSGYKLNTSDTATPVDISYDQRLSAYKILSGNLCGSVSNLERVQLRFNKNVSSGCNVRIASTDLTYNCVCLRRIIFQKLNDYYAPSNFVSKNGNANMSIFNSNDWLNVYPASRYFNETSTVNLTMCPNVPYKMKIDFFFAQSGKKNGQSFNEIIGVHIK